MKAHWYLRTDQKTRHGEAEFTDHQMHVSVSLNEETIEACELYLDWPLTENETIWMNGYQSWTASPLYRQGERQTYLAHLPRRIIDRFALDRSGDAWFLGIEKRKNHFHGFSWCSFQNTERTRLLASLNERNGYTIFFFDGDKQTMRIRKDCAGLRCSGTFPLFDLCLFEGSRDEVYDAWFALLHIQPRTGTKLCGYSSWYNRYQNISENDIAEDLKGCEKVLQNGDMFQIDDGWEEHIGDWVPDAKKFPHGLKYMSDEIHASGYRAGLWLAPFIAETDSRLYREHPSWFLTEEGKPWKAGINWSGYYGLNPELPEVRDYLKEVFARVFEEWNFDLVKLDFLFAGAPFNTPEDTRAGHMYKAMEFLREICGDKLILGCGVPMMPAFGSVDYCRIGPDVSLDWDDKPYMKLAHAERISSRSTIRNTIMRYPLNGRAWMNDPDVFLLREKNSRLSDRQKKALLTVDALLGGVYMTSDPVGDYDEGMHYLYSVGRNLTEAAVDDVRVQKDLVIITYHDHLQKHTYTLALNRLDRH